MDFLANAIWSVTPTVLIGGLFWAILRYTVNADRVERRTAAKIELEERRRLCLPLDGETRQVASTKTNYTTIPQAAEKAEPSDVPTSQYSLLIIEDNPEMREYLAESLRGEYNVACACNGRQALEKAAHMESLHLVIADILMDVMDGYEFYEEFKKNDLHKSIPVIHVSEFRSYLSIWSGESSIKYKISAFSEEPIKSAEAIFENNTIRTNSSAAIDTRFIAGVPI